MNLRKDHSHIFQCHVCARSVVAMYMTFRRLRAWPRVGGGFVDYGQQSSPATFLIIIFTILLFATFVDGLQLYEQHNFQ